MLLAVLIISGNWRLICCFRDCYWLSSSCQSVPAHSWRQPTIRLVRRWLFTRWFQSAFSWLSCWMLCTSGGYRQSCATWSSSVIGRQTLRCGLPSDGYLSSSFMLFDVVYHLFGWPFVWKTRRCRRFLHLSGKCHGFQ